MAQYVTFWYQFPKGDKQNHRHINMNLYFMALIPHQDLMEQVKSLKEEMRDKHGAKHALKSPAHITLVPPFKRPAGYEDFISDALRRFSAARNSFEVRLSGFKSFPPRVIYIDVKNPDSIIELHSGLKAKLLAEIILKDEELKSKIHPHMTIATRDLTREAYQIAWPIFEKREFECKFEVKSLFLLKHNGKFWDIFREFEFNNP